MTRKTLLRYSKVMCAVCLIVLFYFIVDWSQVFETLQHLSIFYAALLLGISVVLIQLSVLKWRLLLRHYGSDASLAYLFRLYLYGYFVNAFVPSQFGGDIARSVSLGKTVGQGDAAKATFLERYSGLVMMLFLGLLCAIFNDSVNTEIRLFIVLTSVGALSASWLLLQPWLLKIVFTGKFLAPLHDKVRQMQESFRELRSKPKLLLKVLGLSLTFHLFTVVNTVCAAYAVGWNDAEFWSIAVVLPIILLIASLPITPSGIGVQESAFYYFLQSLGATAPEAMSVALVLRAKWYVLAFMGGVSWLFEGIISTRNK